MTDKEQVQAFGDDLDKLVDKYAAEFDLSYSATIGALQMKIHTLCQQARDDYNEEEDLGYEPT